MGQGQGRPLAQGRPSATVSDQNFSPGADAPPDTRTGISIDGSENARDDWR